MALPGHSPPPPYPGPGSSRRSLNGYPEPQTTFPMYSSQARPMLPPSPQHFPSRYSQGPPPPSVLTQNDTRPPPPPQTRPGSSMSISSMLGAMPEKSMQDHFLTQTLRSPSRPTSISGPPMSLGAVMSPPQYSSKPNLGEYSYKPRSQTPDRMIGASFGARPHRSSSGTMMQRPGPFYEQPSKLPTSRFGEQPQPFDRALSLKDDPDERARRTSISGILQRPESQPPPVTNGYPNAHTIGRPDSAAPALPNGGYAPPSTTSEMLRPVGLAYDTRPPTSVNHSRLIGPQPKDDRGVSQSASPELRRQYLTENRGLAGILNQAESSSTYNMIRQDSVQSQSERSMFGDRYRSRPYSPFAGSVASQNLSTADDQGRKGSDELSQHRAILGLAAESKRGRYSPLPQAVQGAQAQTPVPDAGIKTEHGRVFSGLGTGMGTSSAAPTPTPGPLPASPFKQNEGAARLSEENLMKMSRSTSGISKRPRKPLDEDLRAESEAGDGKKSAHMRGGKRTKYGHSYKLELEKGGGFGTAVASTNGTNNMSHHLQREQPPSEVAVYKPKKVIKISSVLANAKRLPRRHIGTFNYNPEVHNTSPARPGFEKFDVSVRPNLLPSFSSAGRENCTYSVRIPKLWLQRRERGLICKEACLWGSGIYSDDSDIVAAAMHAGFLSAVAPDNADEGLLRRIVHEQNAKIEGLVDLPEKPIEPEEGKDAVLTLVVLPTLEKYLGSSRFGIQSRTWPENNTKTPHDGVSFAFVKVEFVGGGVESRRMGRTGVQKRARIRQELEERKRAELLQRQMFVAAKKRMREKPKRPVTTSKLAEVTNAQDLALTSIPLTVGQAPGDWLRQAERVAA